MKRLLVVVAVLGLVWACPFPDAIRVYLKTPFWSPFFKHKRDYAPKKEHRLDAPYAGMGDASRGDALGRLRAAYQGRDAGDGRQLVAEARKDTRLSASEREEVELLDAKLDMRTDPAAAQKKLKRFLARAKNPALASEARGWLAFTHRELGEQSAAGKIYLDELQRSDSNLSQEVLLNSLYMLYGTDGGPQLFKDLEHYFDTPAHAAFAIELATNTVWPEFSYEKTEPRTIPYPRIQELLEKHAKLFQAPGGAEKLTLLGMRVALRGGDPAGALRIAGQGEQAPSVAGNPDYLWMRGSAEFLSRRYENAERTLLRLWESRAESGYRAAAAYGLCGVYMKLGNRVEQLRFAFAMQRVPTAGRYVSSGVETTADQSIYWGSSGFDAAIILDAESSIEELEEYLRRYPRSPDAAVVRYSLGVRLAREERYSEAAETFAAIPAPLRAGRMRQLARLAADSSAAGRLALAEYFGANSERLLFNDRIWDRYQSYGLVGEQEVGFNAEERERTLANERQLRDKQEELWRAYRIARTLAEEGPANAVTMRAAELGVSCLRRISVRFGREEEIKEGDIWLSRWLVAARKAKRGGGRGL